MGITGMSLRGQRHWRLGVLTLAVLGLLIGLDSSTAAAATVKRVACQLPFVQGAPNFFCSDLHQILFFTQGYDPNIATIHSELLAMDEHGNVLQSIPVHAGDFAKLTSNTNPNALKVTQLNNLFTVVAPIPVLHVTADDGVTKLEAFCSNIPFIETLQPNDAVVSVSNPADDVTHVLAAIPLTDPSHLVIKVDGVDLLAQLGQANPAACTRVSPCSGDLVNKITNACGGGTLADVKISNLVVDSGAINVYAANTVSFDVTGLGGGGHQFIVKGLARPGSRAKFISASCHDDSLDATSNSSGFGITIDKPTDQETGLSFPVEVQGQICSGNQIGSLIINGNSTFDVTTQTCTKGNPSDPNACTPNSTTADTWTFNFDFPIQKTDVAQDVNAGDTPLGTFDPGSNRLIVSATDDAGNRTFSTRYFGTGTTLNTGVSAVKPVLEDLVKDAATQVLPGVPLTVDVPNAFVIGLNTASIQQQITQKCTAPKTAQNPKGGAGQIFHDAVFKALAPNGFPAIVNLPLCKAPATPCGTTTTITVSPSCSCTVNTHVWITAIDLDPTQISCPAVFDDHVIHATINLPSITLHLQVGADGQGNASVCETDLCGPLGCACIAKTTVYATDSITMSGLNFAFDITETQLCEGDPQCANTAVPPLSCPSPGKLQNGGCFNAGTTTDPKANLDDSGTGLDCLSVVCEVFAVVIDFLSFGALDLAGIDISLDPDFTTALGNTEPDPIKLHDMKVDPEQVQGHNQTISGKLSSVQIDPNGLLAGLKGTFATLQVDSEIQQTPGALITQPPLPTLPQAVLAGAQDASILVSTDTLNMLNAGMTIGGALKTTCKPQFESDGITPKTVGDLLPHLPQGCTPGDPGCNVACDTLGATKCAAGDTKCEAVVALEQGVCHGINLAACEGLTASSTLLTAIKQGACHGTKGDNCNSIPVSTKLVDKLAERATCKATPNLDLNKNQPLLVCTRQDIPPVLLPLSGGGPSPVDSILRLKALSVGLVVDRDKNGALETSLADTPQCGPKAKTGDCFLFEACLDVNANFDLQFVPDSDPTCTGETGIKAIFKHVNAKVFPGALCNANGGGTQDTDVVDQSNKTKVVDKDLPTAAQAAAPPICMKGFDLGGFVTCSTPTLLTIETNGDPTSKDWLGVTCKIAP